MDKSENEKKWVLNYRTQMGLLFGSLFFAVMITVTQNVLYLIGWAVFYCVSFIYGNRADKYYKLTIKELDDELDRLTKR